MPVAPARADVENAFFLQQVDESAEAALIPVTDKILLDVEGHPSRVGDKIEAMRKGGRRDIVKPQGRDHGHAVEIECIQPLFGLRRQASEVFHEILVIESGTISPERLGRLFDDIDTDQGLDPDLGQLGPYHAVSGADVQHFECGITRPMLVHVRFEQPADDFRRVAFVALIKQVFIETGNRIDFVIIVKSDLLLFPVGFDEKELLPLFDLCHFRKMQAETI
jgi:hypothetical protein